jgi:hypothetical protein
MVGTMPAAVFRFGLATLCLGLLAWGLSVWPLPVLPAAITAAALAAALWFRPVLFLLIVPAALPALDFGLWTGWMDVGEADFVILLTIAILLIRVPLVPSDIVPRGAAGAVFWLFAALLLAGVAIGLAAPAGDTVNPFLARTNALRLAKGFVEAAALLPFLRQRRRVNGDALTWLTAGLALALILVALEVVVERDLFPGLLDLGADYRVVAAFSSMRVGGGHIGACLALALPFALIGCVAPRRMSWLALAVPGLIGGGYALAMTFARTGYLAGAAGCAVAGVCLLAAPRRAAGPMPRILAAIGAAIVLLGIGGAAASGVMRQRFADAATDLLTRESNWREGWDVRDPGLMTQLAGMGLGTYQRIMRARGRVNVPSDLVLGHDPDGAFVTMRVSSPLYLGQKISLPAADHVRLHLRYRAEDAGAVLGYSLCDKMLVYSDQCRGGQVRAAHAGVWETMTADIPTRDLRRAGALTGLRRPVELSLFDPVAGSAISVGGVSLTDAAGQPLLVNGDFRHGLDRWLFTDDSHVSWRILNQYLMILFEGGVLGLLSWLALCGLAMAGGWRGLARGEPAGAAIMGGVASFLVSGLFDNVLEAPRIATLFYLIAGAGLMLWEGRAAVAPNRRAPPAPVPAPVEEY